MEKLIEYVDGTFGWQSLLIIFILLITGLPTFIKGWDFLIDRFGIETKGSRQRKEQAQKCIVQGEAIKALENKLAEYNKSNIEHWTTSKNYQSTYNNTQKEIMQTLLELKTQLNDMQEKIDENELHKKIENLRTEIIGFATNLANPSFKPSTDHYNNIFKKIKKYEHILEENGLENGQCSISIHVIERHYEAAIEEGLLSNE